MGAVQSEALLAGLRRVTLYTVILLSDICIETSSDTSFGLGRIDEAKRGS